MKKLFITLSIIMLFAAFKRGTVNQIGVDFSHIKEFIPVNNVNYYVDSINGYSTFSAENNIIIVPEEITKKQYKDLLTDKYVFHSKNVESKTTLFTQLDNETRKNVKVYNKLRELYYDNELNKITSSLCGILHYPEIKQYEYYMATPTSLESFMMTEDGIIDSTFMQTETSSYGKNRIFVGQQGHNCDFHGDLWFYWYDEKNYHMVPICHYVDYRWHEDTSDFNLCWISDNELLVSAVSTGNSVYGWVGGYKPQNLAPHWTPVYYKLKLTIQKLPK